jgi:hypothetical protein
MEDKQNTGDNSTRKPVVIPPGELVQNPNPKANENIRVGIDEPKTQNTKPAQGVGSEITDGEDA